MKHNIKIKNSDRIQHQNLLNEILNAEPYCDFWSAKIRIINYLKQNYPDEFENVTRKESGQFIIDALSCILDHVAYEKDLKELKNENISEH